jgi:signal transduction histidine kinase
MDPKSLDASSATEQIPDMHLSGRSPAEETSMQRELEEARLLKEALVNMVSHEFKTPLATIIGFAGLLEKKDSELSQEQREKYLETIARQAERLNRLVENLLLSARPVLAPSGSTARMGNLAEAVKAQLSGTYEDVELEVEIPADLRPRMSHEALRLVVTNLASNAIKHAAPGSVVEIKGHREGNTVVMTVSNEGDPIPEAVRERIFEPFVQSDDQARSAEGVGLGLHIVHKVVTAHGGTVGVGGTGRRVTFTIRIPEAISQRRTEPLAWHEMGASA